MISRKVKPLILKISLVGIVISLMIIAGGCLGVGGAQAGWSGVAFDNGSLYFGSTGGQIIKMDAESGAQVWYKQFEASSSGTILGCGGGTTAVALYGTPVIDGDLVYVAAFDGKIYALNTTAGAERWVYPREGNLYSFVGGPIIYNGKLYAAAANGTIYALDTGTGDLVWETELKEDVWASPVIYNGTLYAGTYDKKVYALDAENGEEIWQQPFEAEGPVISQPLADNNVVYATSLDRRIYALDAASGELIWKFPNTDGNGENTPKKWFWASPVLSNGKIYAANMDGNVYVVEAASGNLVTVIELEDAVSATPVLAGDKLFVATEEGNLFIIDTADNSKLELPALSGKVAAPLTTVEGIVYIHTKEDEIIYAINAETGVPLWNAPISND